MKSFTYFVAGFSMAMCLSLSDWISWEEAHVLAVASSSFSIGLITSLVRELRAL